MGTTKTLRTTILVAAVLAGCSDDDKVQFSRVVTFGSSVADAGAYKVGTIATLGGGKYTVNGPEGLTWTERLALMVKAPAECAAQTGLLPNIGSVVGAPVQNFGECFNYAQGSSRVSSSGTGPSGVALQQILGEKNVGVMAVSLREQMETHLAKVGGRFDPADLVIVEGGGSNDAFMQLSGVGRAATGGAAAVAAGRVAGWPQATLDVVASGGDAAVSAARAASIETMARIGAELAGYVNTLLIGNGARYVLVRNLPNPKVAPLGLSQDSVTQEFRAAMHQAYNAQLKMGLSDVSATFPRGVLLFDDYQRSEEMTNNPGKFGFSNVTSPRCGPNPFGGNSIVCNESNLVAGDTSRYAYADTVHPTPYAHIKAAEFAMSLMVGAGWQ